MQVILGGNGRRRARNDDGGVRRGAGGGGMRRRRAAAAGRAARGLHGAQSGSSAPAGGAAGRCWKRGDTPPCALWRTAATRAFIPARAACCRCWRKTALRRGCCRAFPACSFWPRVWAAPGRTGRSSPPTARRATRLRRCAAADRCFSSRAARSARPRCARSCAKRAWAGWPSTVGENLSYPDERVTQATAAQCAQGAFAPLSVLLAEAAPRAPQRAPGIADSAFARGEVPMTKQEVRAAAPGQAGRAPGRRLLGRGRGHGQRERGAGFGRAPRPRVRGGVRSRRLRAASAGTGSGSERGI